MQLPLLLLAAAELVAGLVTPSRSQVQQGPVSYLRNVSPYGQLGQPGAVVQAKEFAGDEPLFSTAYHMDADGWRVIPEGGGDRDRYLLLFGSSHAFGFGVADDETIPYFLSRRLPSSHVYDVSLPSLGLNSFYALTDDIRSHVPLREKQGDIVLLFHTVAVDRSVATPSTIFWEGGAPFYRLGNDLKLEYQGSFESALPLRYWFWRWASQRNLYRRLAPHFPPTGEDLETVCHMIVQGRENLRRQLPGASFRVILIDDKYEPLQGCLARNGVTFFTPSDDGIPRIPVDGHYTPEGNQRMAELVLRLMGEKR